jgi:microcystin-dependent protein
MSNPFLGEIRVFGFNFNPRGWARCQGQLMPIAQNDALYALIGTTYGGDGQTTFALPDLSSRVPLGQGQGPGLANYVTGEMSGTEGVNLLTSQLPAHTHPVNATATANSKSPAGTVPAFAAAAIYGDPGTLAMNPQMNMLAGNGQPVSIVQPCLTVNFCIALEGVFPSRN